MIPYRNAAVSGEKQVREWRELVPGFVERLRKKAGLLLLPFDQHARELGGLELRDGAGQRLQWDDVHSFVHEQVTDLGLLEHVLEQVPDLIDLREAFEDGDEPLMLPARCIRLDQVVVEKVLARARRYGE